MSFGVMLVASGLSDFTLLLIPQGKRNGEASEKGFSACITLVTPAEVVEYAG